MIVNFPDKPTTCRIAPARGILSLLWSTFLVLTLGACQQVNEDPEPHYQSARAYMESGKAQAAVLEAKNALRIDPGLQAARSLLGEAYLVMENPEAASTHFQRLRDQGAAEELWLSGLSLSLIRQGQAEQAVEVLKLREDHAPTVRELIYVHLALAAITQARLEQAALFLQLAQMQGLDSALLHLGMAERALASDDLGETYLGAGRAIERQPDYLDAWLLRAEAARLFGNLDLAIEHFETAIALSPDSPRARLGVASAALGLGKFDLVEQQVGEVEQRFGRSAGGDFLMALVRYEQGESDAAEELLLSIISKHSHPSAEMMLGMIKYAKGEYNQAYQYLRNYHNTAPSDLEAIKMLAATLIKMEQTDNAWEILWDNRVKAGEDPQFLALLGSTGMQVGEYEKSLDLLSQAVALDPKMSFMVRQIAVTGDPGGTGTRTGAPGFDSATTLDQELFELDLISAQALLAQGKPAEAAAIAEKLLENPTLLPYAYNLLGSIALAQDNPIEASEYWQSALELKEDYVGALVNLANLSYGQGQTDNAVHLLTRALAADPQHQLARLQLAELLLAQGDINAAQSLLLQGPEDQRAGIDYLGLLAHTYRLSGRFREAADIYQQLDIATNRADVKAALASTLLAAGLESEAQEVRTAMLGNRQPKEVVVAATLAAIEARDGEQVRHAVNVVRNRFGDEGTADYLVGEYHFSRQDWGPARKALESSFGKNPNATVAQRLALTHKAQGNPDRASELLVKWLQQHPGDAYSWWIYGDILRTNAELGTAAESYQRAVLLLGPEPSLLNNLAWTLGELQHEDALRVAKQALQAAPGRADIADTAGWIYFRAGDADTARELLEQAVETDPGNLDYQMHLAEIVASLGDTDVARAILAQAASGASEEHRAEIALLQERIAGYN